MSKYLFIIVVLLLSGCATVHVETYNPETKEHCEAYYGSLFKEVKEAKGSACGSNVGATESKIKELETTLGIILEMLKTRI